MSKLRRLRDGLRNSPPIVAHTPFYRKYPYKRGITLHSADRRGCVDTELRCFYNRLPKAANSTVLVNLAQLKYGELMHADRAKRGFRRPSSLTGEEVSQFKDFYKFTFARNPYSRVLSAYLDKVQRPGRVRGNTPEFPEFLHALERDQLYSNGHWAPQASLLLIPAAEFDFIGRVESLATDLPAVMSAIGGQGMTVETGTLAFRDHATNATDKLMQFYTTECEQLVRTLYAIDFELFDYSIELPV